MGKNYLEILGFLKKYSGHQYKMLTKCESDTERAYMMEGSGAGKSAREAFTALVKEIESKYGFEHDRITQWQNSGTFVSYFWCQMKRPDKKESQISLSLFAEKVVNVFRFRVSVELGVEKATPEDILAYKRLLDRPLEPGFVYVSGGNNESEFRVLEESDNNIVKKLGLKKVQVSFIADEGKYHNDEELSNALLEASDKLVTYYDSLFGKSPKQGSDASWWPSLSEYNPGITKDQWLELLRDGSTFTDNAYFAIAAMYDIGGEATCRQLADRYGQKSDFYRTSLGVQVADKVKKKLSTPECVDEDGKKWIWPILFQGRDATKEEAGSYVWKIRPELHDALTEFDIKRYLKTDSPQGDARTMPDSIKETISKIKTYIAANGFTYPDGLIENFYLSLKSKPFVILAGTSGTGKTRLVKLFAEAVGATPENGRYCQVAVRPDWSDGSDLFGHYDLNGHFVEGPICPAFEAAEANPERPVFICLDEMNLARVEYYLSDFLSVIESREKEADGSIRTSAIAQYEGGIPENLYIVGTVNMDETTFPFSKKVLDRANTIEFSHVDLMPAFEDAATGEEPLALPNKFLRSEYLLLVRDCAEDAPYVGEICSILQEINGILLEANAHVGYRVRDEIVFYMLNTEHAEGLISKDQAMDNEIMQKILPRIQGSSASVKTMLCKLFAVCAADHTQKAGETDSEKMRKILEDEGVICRYKKSAEKIEMMVRRFEEDGFTSYWL